MPMKIETVLSLLLLLAVFVFHSFSYAPMGFTIKRSNMTMKRGRGSFQNEIGGGSSSSFSSGMSQGRNWLNTNKSVKELPIEEGKVGLLETNAFLLINKQTNPAGAVSVLKYEGETYCFDANCPQCKIPMTKAYPLPPNEETKNDAPRVACDFCRSTYNLKNGARLTSQESRGLFGGIAKSLLSAQESGPLKIYQLGEKNGKVMFSMD